MVTTRKGAVWTFMMGERCFFNYYKISDLFELDLLWGDVLLEFGNFTYDEITAERPMEFLNRRCLSLKD